MYNKVRFSLSIPSVPDSGSSPFSHSPFKTASQLFIHSFSFHVICLHTILNLPIYPHVVFRSHSLPPPLFAEQVPFLFHSFPLCPSTISSSLIDASMCVLSLTVLLSVEKRSFFRGELRDLCLKKNLLFFCGERANACNDEFVYCSKSPPSCYFSEQTTLLSFIFCPSLSYSPLSSSSSIYTSLSFFPFCFMTLSFIFHPTNYFSFIFSPLRRLHSLPIRFPPFFFLKKPLVFLVLSSYSFCFFDYFFLFLFEFFRLRVFNFPFFIPLHFIIFSFLVILAFTFFHVFSYSLSLFSITSQASRSHFIISFFLTH
ncbi:unnamed protein product [Acanthosepion pharaonis]|uniref:Uncharacterized protein n=1 Tax=Acanthosepion pharaonis TaxID=158019 RepID=A0A812AN88_ACAPH|nr:unnamed protein product [Sepia pharaonis]